MRFCAYEICVRRTGKNGIGFWLFCRIFIVDNHKSFQKKAVINQDFPSAVRDNRLGKASGGNHRTCITEFLFNPFDSAVDTGGRAVNDAASHTVYRV